MDMGFSALLGLAKEKQSTTKKNPVRFSLEVAAAKKAPRDKKLSENVKRYLAKQEEEDRKKRIEAKLRTENLLQLRKEDKRSTRTMNSMLQRTKSSNKAVIAEAKNLRDTNDTLAGREQCDEDDYGYESHAASSLFEKLMSKYEGTPKEDPMAKFAPRGSSKKDMSKTVARVRDRLDNPVEEGEPHKRHRHKRGDTANGTSEKKSKDEGTKGLKDQKKAKVKRSGLPPPPSFSELMKLAQQKHKEPVKVEKKEVREAEFDRPMTKKEKEDYLKERHSQLRKAGKLPPAAVAKEDEKSAAKTAATKPSSTPTPLPPPPEKKRPVITGPEFHPAVVKKEPIPPPPKPSTSSSSSSKLLQQQLQQKGNNNLKRPIQSSSGRSRYDEPNKRPRKSQSRSPSPVAASSRGGRPRHNRIESESEEEEDSDMDDFIDDTDAKVDISAEIRNLFGYDRRKYKDEDDFDDRSMENNRFSEVMKEEARSARIGMMEDLEDMRMEEEEKKRKKLKNKGRR